jgi:hypothetical protein
MKVKRGRDLLVAKNLVNHGDWQPVSDRGYNRSERAARYYMRVASNFDGKTANFADLWDGLRAYREIERDVRKALLQRAEAGESATRR